jgi:serine/threonine protein kinase
MGMRAMANEILDNRYELLEELGSSPISTLYKAKDLKENTRIVALKVLKEEYSYDPEIVSRFINRSAAAVEASNHKYIAQIYSPAIKGEKVYSIREYIEGLSLRERLQKNGRLSDEEIKEIVPQICEALHAAHSQKVIHGGLTPENIIITPEGEVKITDFGLSFLSLLLSLEENEIPAGALEYLKYAAPEQFSKNKIEDERTDIYLLGIIIHEMFSGVVPFSGTNFQQYKEAHCQGSIPEIPIVINLSLQKDPDERYQGARELGRDIDKTEIPPLLALYPDKFNLGEIKEDERKTLVFKIRNNGKGKLNGKIEVDPSYRNHIKISPDRFELVSEEEEIKEIEIHVELDTKGIKSGANESTIRVASNGGDKTISITWRNLGKREKWGRESRFVIKPEQFNFGRFRLRERKKNVLLIRNIGDSPLEGNLKVSHSNNIYISNISLDLEEEGLYRFRLNPKEKIKVKVILEKQGLPTGNFNGKIDLSINDERRSIPVLAEIRSPLSKSLPQRLPKRTAGLMKISAKWASISLLIFAVLIGIYYGGRYFSKRFRHPQEKTISAKAILPEIANFLGQGNFVQAKSELEKVLLHDPDNADIKNVLNKLSSKLAFNINFHYLSGKHQNINKIPRIPSGGRYRLEYNSNDSNYLYVYQVDAHGDIELLFPNPEYSDDRNPIKAGRTYWLPPNKPVENWFHLDDHTGKEKIYLVASRWHSLDMETLFDQFKQASSKEKMTKIRAKLLERLESRNEASGNGVKGVFYKVIPFEHVERDSEKELIN